MSEQLVGTTKPRITPTTNPELFRKGLGIYVYFEGGPCQGFLVDPEAGDKYAVGEKGLVIYHANKSEEHINLEHVLWFRVQEVDVRIKKGQLQSPIEVIDDSAA